MVSKADSMAVIFATYVLPGGGYSRNDSCVYFAAQKQTGGLFGYRYTFFLFIASSDYVLAHENYLQAESSR
jgi:hypothetical protein